MTISIVIKLLVIIVFCALFTAMMIVPEMRTAQKCYFRTRSQKSLEKSKELEKNVDDIIAKREAMQKGKQLNLFEETKE